MRKCSFLPLAAGLICALGAATAAGIAQAADLDQGWSAEQRVAWYESTQGSRLLPFAWFKALEMADSTVPFNSDGHMSALRFVPRDMVSRNERLPRGFVIDATDDTKLSYSKLRWKAGQSSTEEWVGMTCAACHTTTMTYNQVTLTIDGGPTMADFQTFVEDLDKALAATAADPAKFGRFASKVLAGADTPANQTLLKDALSQVVQFETDIEKLNHTDMRYGFGRLDAVGHILNKIAKISGAPAPQPNPADAPVSYPFLWNVPQHDVVQWNGMAPNKPIGALIGTGLDVGALGRNTGEVIGVFGDIVPTPGAGLGGYESSVNVANLRGMEDLLTKLRPPRWPGDVFKPIDMKAAAKGGDIFKTMCQDCHAVMDRTDLSTPITAKMVHLAPHGGESPIGTDPWMACRAFTNQSSAGAFKGARRPNGNGTITEVDALSDMLGVAVIETLLGRKVQIAGGAAAGFFGIKPLPEPVKPSKPSWLARIVGIFALGVKAPTDKELLKVRCETTDHPMLAYKGRPLNGIWATAPYLHNGSVPTLYELLLDPSQRHKSFYTGSIEFDPMHVGFVTDQAPNNPFPFDATKDGNSNAGHDYGVGSLSDVQRYQLIEFMKTL